MSKSYLTEPIFYLDDVLQFSYNRWKEDYLKISSNPGVNLNSSGQIKFELNNAQHYISLSESFLVGEFSITKADDSALGNDDITLENNFFFRMFSGIRIEVGGREVENIAQAVGEASTLANFIMMPAEFKRTYGLVSGWCPDTNKGDNDVDNTANDANQGYYFRKKFYNTKKTFSMIFPLKSVFGFTEYTKILTNIKIGLILTRKDNSVIMPDIFYGATANPALTAKLVTHNLAFWVPYIEPSLEIEELVTKRLNTNKPINMLFMKRSMNEITIPAGATQTWRIGNYANSVRFVIVGFKTTVAPSEQTNNALFTEHVGGNKISSLRMQLNNKFYPIDEMKMEFDAYKVHEPYQAYVNMCHTFGVEPQISIQEFIDLHAVFCFDLSAQPETLKANGIDITLHIKKSSALTLQGFALVLEDAHYQLEVADGRILRLA